MSPDREISSVFTFWTFCVGCFFAGLAWGTLAAVSVTLIGFALVSEAQRQVQKLIRARAEGRQEPHQE